MTFQSDRDGDGDGHLLFSVLKDKQWTLWTMAMKERRPTAFGDVHANDPTEGVFSRDGRWVAYQRIPFTTAPRVAFGQPEEFSRFGRTEGSPDRSRRAADSMPDGEHIIGVYTGGGTGVTEVAQIQVVLNWFDEVRQRSPRK